MDIENTQQNIGDKTNTPIFYVYIRMVYMHKKVYKNLLTSAEWLNLDRVRIKE